MLRRPSHLTWLALALAALTFGFGRGLAPGVPGIASLAGLFALIGLTRLAQAMGGRAHAPARLVASGLALAAAVWFGGAALFTGPWTLALLALGYVAAAALAVPPEPGDPAIAGRSSLAAAGALVLSLLAVASLPDEVRPSAVWVPSLLAAAVIVSVAMVARKHAAAQVPLGIAAVIAVSYAARALAVWANDASPPPVTRLAAVTMALAGAPLVAAATRRLPELLRRAAPGWPPGRRTVVAILALPTLGVAATALLTLR